MRDDCATVARWAADQQVPHESTVELSLPARWARLDYRGKVLAAQTGDARVCLLFKARVGWKDNFEGVFYCNAPLRRGEIVAGSGGRQYISLPGLGPFEELYIRQPHGSQLFEVYFDLH
jgi:hypothetical protein